MPVCCVVKCSARKNKNHPQLTMHRFPKNEALRKKWLEAIGEGNINPRHKVWYVCSIHFEDTCFNRTLDVMRLRDNSIPTLFLAPVKKLHQNSSVLCETSKLHQNSSVLCETSKLHQKPSVLCETSNIKKPVVSCTSTVMLPLQSPHRIVKTVLKQVTETKRIKTLKEKCFKQQQEIKSLNEMLRKKNKRIANLNDIIEELRRKNSILQKKLC